MRLLSPQEHYRAALAVHSRPSKTTVFPHLVDGLETEQSVEAHRFFDAVNVEQRSVVAGLGNHRHYSDLQSLTIVCHSPYEATSNRLSPESARLTPGTSRSRTGSPVVQLRRLPRLPGLEPFAR